MNAIRRDESTDNIHSIFVDQWDWEKIIHKEDRNLDYLKEPFVPYISVFAKQNSIWPSSMITLT